MELTLLGTKNSLYDESMCLCIVSVLIQRRFAPIWFFGDELYEVKDDAYAMRTTERVPGRMFGTKELVRLIRENKCREMLLSIKQ